MHVSSNLSVYLLSLLGCIVIIFACHEAKRYKKGNQNNNNYYYFDEQQQHKRQLFAFNLQQRIKKRNKEVLFALIVISIIFVILVVYDNFFYKIISYKFEELKKIKIYDYIKYDSLELLNEDETLYKKFLYYKKNSYPGDEKIIKEKNINDQEMIVKVVSDVFDLGVQRFDDFMKKVFEEVSKIFLKYARQKRENKENNENDDYEEDAVEIIEQDYSFHPLNKYWLDFSSHNVQDQEPYENTLFFYIVHDFIRYVWIEVEKKYPHFSLLYPKEISKIFHNCVRPAEFIKKNKDIERALWKEIFQTKAFKFAKLCFFELYDLKYSQDKKNP